jgi:hypothetical protein
MYNFISKNGREDQENITGNKTIMCYSPKKMLNFGGDPDFFPHFPA